MALRIILVRTHNPGNIGAAARAAKNFGAEIFLLGPRTDPVHPDAISFASGAEDLLRKVTILPAWSDLLSGRETLVAMSAMRGRVSRGLPPSTTFKEVSGALRAGRKMALVFGPERGGLTTEELQSCDVRLRIATAEEFPTLNLAQSVAIALAFLSPASPLSPLKAPRRSRGTPTPEEQPAVARDVRRLLLSFKEVLSSAGYPGRGRSKEVIPEIESFLRRGKPSAREVTLLLGALAALRRGLGVSPSKLRP